MPTPLSSLIGREREIAAVTALMADPTVRLVTLTGPGGVGKTRLALRLAADLAGAGRFADGAAFVDLAAVRDPDHVAPTIAQTLGVRGFGQEPAEAALRSFLRAKDLLLVLDNFEQVVEAGPRMTELLRACPGLTMLVTSRARLNVSGEHAKVVPPLDSDAVRLFVERARAAGADFALSQTNTEAVAAICRRLDGLPLAIELAAARSAMFAPPAMLARLERRLPQLTGGPRDLPGRQQTMRDAIAWSYDLLTPVEQAVFRCLAAFVGGCALEAAETVCPVPDVVAAIESLTRQSLLGVVESPSTSTGAGSPRLVILETVREYALERLAESGEEAAVRGRHAAWCLDLAERYEHADLLPDNDQAVARLEAEHANLRAALAWLEEAGEPEPFLRLAAALGRFWAGQALYHEGRAWLERALAHGGTPMADRGKALVHLGTIEFYQGANRDAETRLTAGLAGCRAEEDTFHVALALLLLGGLAILQRDHGRGTALLEESFVAAHDVGDPRLAGIMTGLALINLAPVARAHGDRELAAERLETGLLRLRVAGYTEGMIMALGELGDLARDRGELTRALELHREALGLVRGSPGTRPVTEVIEALGIDAVAVGQAERGARLLGATEARRERIGLRYRVAENQVALEQAVAAARAALDEPAFAAAWAAGRDLRLDQAVAEGLALAATPTTPPRVALTPRETEILRRLAAGLTDADMAESLFLSVRTVEHHVASVLAKFGVRSRAAAVVAGRAAGLVPPGNPPDPPA